MAGRIGDFGVGGFGVLLVNLGGGGRGGGLAGSLAGGLSRSSSRLEGFGRRTWILQALHLNSNIRF